MFAFTGALPSLLGFSYYCPILVLQSNASMIETAVVPVQFYYRYYTLKQGKSPSLLRTFLWFLLSISFCSITTFTLLSKFCPADVNSKLVDYGQYWFSEVRSLSYTEFMVVSGSNSDTSGLATREFF